MAVVELRTKFARRLRCRAARRARAAGVARGCACVAGVIVACVAWGGLFGTARAGSVFAREALGEWLEGYTLSGEALGATGIGLADAYNAMGPNAAAGAFAEHTLGYAALGTTLAWSTDGERTARRGSSLFSGMGVCVPLPRGFGFRLLARPVTDGSYAVEEVVETGSGSAENVRREEGSRGLLFYGADVLWRPGAPWALAGGVGWITGSLLDETTWTYADSGSHGSSDRRETRVEPAAVFSAGAIWRPAARLSLGATFSGPLSCEIREKYRAPAGAEISHRGEVSLPRSLGAGGAIRVRPRWRLTADLIWREWEAFSVSGTSWPPAGIEPLRNTVRWGVGIERTARLDRGASAWDRVAWRCGYARIPWYLKDADGDGVDEWRLTGGAGLPVGTDRGLIDLTVVWGRRGSSASNGIEERFFQLGIGFTFARMLREY